MLYHHSSESYDQAASEASRRAKVKMEEIIHRGRASALQTIEAVQNSVISDSIVKGSALDFTNSGKEILCIRPDKSYAPFHKHGLSQAMAKTGVTSAARYAESLIEAGSEDGREWGAELVAHNLRTIYQNGNGARYLLREEAGQIKGFLSDKFRRLDSRPLLEAFCTACMEMGILPYEGFALDTKFRLRAVMPQIYEPIANEPQLYGLEWGNSDYGDGCHAVKIWNMRLWCSNCATLDDVLRQVHLGGRLSDNIAYSAATYELDTKANAAALQDVVRHALAPATIETYNRALVKANEEKISARDATSKLKEFLSKGEAELVTEAFNSPDIENLPAGQTVYRLSNAISWVANSQEIEPSRKIELQDYAGRLLPRLEKVKALEV